MYASGRLEIGWFPVEVPPPAPVTVFHWRGDSFDLLAGVEHIARSARFEQQAFSHEQRVLAVQRHHPQMDPASVAILTDAVGTDLTPGASVQSADAMRQQTMHFDPARRLLDACPTCLAG